MPSRMNPAQNANSIGNDKQTTWIIHKGRGQPVSSVPHLGSCGEYSRTKGSRKKPQITTPRRGDQSKMGLPLNISIPEIILILVVIAVIALFVRLTR